MRKHEISRGFPFARCPACCLVNTLKSGKMSGTKKLVSKSNGESLVNGESKHGDKWMAYKATALQRVIVRDWVYGKLLLFDDLYVIYR